MERKQKPHLILVRLMRPFLRALLQQFDCISTAGDGSAYSSRVVHAVSVCKIWKKEERRTLFVLHRREESRQDVGADDLTDDGTDSAYII